MTSVSCHVICWEGPEWCVPQLIVEGPLQKANKIVEEMNRSEEAKQGLGWPELSCFVVKSNIQKVVV